MLVQLLLVVGMNWSCVCIAGGLWVHGIAGRVGGNSICELHAPAARSGKEPASEHGLKLGVYFVLLS